MMTNDNTVVHNRCVALAGIFQAARLVQQTGRAEKRDPVATTACINSLFVTDPQAVSDVYGSTADLQVGLQTLQQQLSSSTAGRDLELTGYVITLMHLQRKLRRRDDLMKTIRAGLDGLTPGPLATISDNVELIAGLADIYKETISTLSPRIMVKGDENVLGNSSSQNMIRALLLAGIRATVLWSQYGGSRIKLIFQRKVMIEQCSRMLRAGVQSV